MTIASPALAIAGLLAITLPIAIHLFFRRRQKPIEWAAMELLVEAIRRTTRRQRVQKLILLVLRCIAIAMVAIAVSGPLLKDDNSSASSSARTTRELVVVLDDGVAQQTTQSGDSSFETSRSALLDAINTLEQGDRVGVFLAAGSRQFVWPPSEDLASTRNAIESLEVSNSASDLANTVSLASQPGRTIAVASGFRRGSVRSGWDAAEPGEGVRTVLTKPDSREVDNTQLLDCQVIARGPLTPRNTTPIRVRLSREGGNLNAHSTIVELSTQGGSRTTTRVVWGEGQKEAVVDSSVITTDDQRAELPLRAEIMDSDGQPADNSRFTIIPSTGSIHVGIVDRPASITGSFEPGVGDWVERALRPTDDVGVETEVIDPTAIEINRIRKLNALVVVRPDLIDKLGWEVLKRSVDDGMVLVVLPPSATRSGVWADGFLASMGVPWKVSRETINSETPQSIVVSDQASRFLQQIAAELSDLSQPVSASQWFKLETPPNSADVVLSLADQSPWIIRSSPGDARGSIILFASTLDLAWTNLPAKPMMVPLFQEILRQSIATIDQGRRLVVGSQTITGVPSGTSAIQPVLTSGAAAAAQLRPIACDPSGNLSQPITQPGVYRCVDGAERTTGLLVVNIDTAAASTTVTTPEELLTLYQGANAIIADGSMSNEATSASATTNKEKALPIAPALDGQSLAVWCFVALLALMVVETWFARKSSVGSRLEPINGGSV